MQKYQEKRLAGWSTCWYQDCQDKYQYEEIWAPKNLCFWIVVLEKTFENPLDCKEIKPIHPKGNYPEYSLEGLILKLKLQYVGHLMRRADSLEKTLMLGKIESRRKRGRQRMRGWMASPTQWPWVWASSGSWWWTGKPDVLQSMGSQRVRHDWATELNWVTAPSLYRNPCMVHGPPAMTWGADPRIQELTKHRPFISCVQRGRGQGASRRHFINRWQRWPV